MVSLLWGLSIHMIDILSAECPGRLKCLATGVFLLWRASAQCSTSLSSRVRQVSPTYWDWQSVQVRRYTTFSVWQVRCLRVIMYVSPVEELGKMAPCLVWQTGLPYLGQPFMFVVARPTCATCKRTSSKWTIGWQGRPNNHVFDIRISEKSVTFWVICCENLICILKK